MKKKFTVKLLDWNTNDNKRIMPWKGETNPYKIWLSEIILQQTRVQQGLSYYNKLLKQYPTVFHLAKAPDGEVFKLWEGLGYYSRCKNLLETARMVVNERAGIFPDSYKGLLALKGVGPYTAAAIASFAYNLPHAVVDGNVFRVLSRFFGIDTPIDTTEGNKLYGNLANQLLRKTQAGTYNQAIMDFGAIVCKPQLPLCQQCNLKADCVAYNTSRTNILPKKEKRIVKKKRYLNYLVFVYGNNYYIEKRTGKDIWQNLYEFFLYETNNQVNWNELLLAGLLTNQLGIKDYNITKIYNPYTQQLTHQLLHGQFIVIALQHNPTALKGLLRVNKQALSHYAFPRLINQFLDDAFAH